MTSAQKLNPVDASFLHLEGPNTHMHIGGCAIFEPSAHGGGVGHYEALIRLLEPRLDRMPRYRQKLAFVPLRLDTPVWVDDGDFEIHNHLLRAALPAPGGDRELQQYASRVFSRPLDRRRPLWELYVIEGLRAGRWAILTKTHHAMVDGISNVELLTALLDIDPAVPDDFGESRWQPEESPTAMELLVRSMRDRADRPGHFVGAARHAVSHPRRLVNTVWDTAGGLLATLSTVRAPKGVLNGRTGPSRAWTYARHPLADFRAVKAALGGTVNDVVLAAVTGGVRLYLIEQGVNPADQVIQALCPVSLRTPEEQGALGNRLAMLLVRLPIDESDPARRLARVRRTVDSLKERKQAVGADFLLNMVGFSPSTLHALAARASLRAIGFNLIVTNVPGPQFALYCLGCRLLEAFPAAFLYDGQRVAVAVFSYDGQFNFGFIADAHAMPDLDRFAACVGAGLAELVSAAERKVAASAARSTGTTKTTPTRRTRAGASAGSARTSRSRVKSPTSAGPTPEKPSAA
jgi:diacylglycerol O-acyltransferase